MLSDLAVIILLDVYCSVVVVESFVPVDGLMCVLERRHDSNDGRRISVSLSNDDGSRLFGLCLCSNSDDDICKYCS